VTAEFERDNEVRGYKNEKDIISWLLLHITLYYILRSCCRLRLSINFATFPTSCKSLYDPPSR
jgi:hypothetical protein